MTEPTQQAPGAVVYSPASVNPQGLMHIGAVASHNIAAALGMPAEHAAVIETAIKDEIDAMSAHFSLAFRDIQDQYEIEVAKLAKEKEDFITATKARETVAVGEFKAAVAQVKSTFNYVEQNTWHVIAVLAATFVFGVLLGHFV